ncbi:hypothetical protein OCO52_21565 [Achromobacter mucicolens]|uniref:hypothetical protein n=1 Tax=Achromobacter mucicolens TaxID=1389922 RepID=UPI0021CFB7BB|nr:hypothetical protein [Achromobacter mucicolens]MCU6619086.1 hypothetical protein [Achromobacter mucicolens]
MKTRNLYAEIAEGFAALSDARSVNLTLSEMYVLMPWSREMGPEARESEFVDGILNSPAGEFSDAVELWAGGRLAG